VTTYTYGQLETLWLDTAKGTSYATTAWAELMAAIAMAESSGESDAYNSSGATGLWQILGAVNPSDQSSLTDPAVNAKEALLKLQSQGLGAWVTYTSGAYKQFLASGVNPASLPAAGATGNTTDSLSTSSSILGIPTEITGAFGHLDTILTDILSPSFWLRIASFFAGVGLLVAGVWCLMHASDDTALLPDMSKLPSVVPV
jgi:hypothetical protein